MVDMDSRPHNDSPKHEKRVTYIVATMHDIVDISCYRYGSVC